MRNVENQEAQVMTAGIINSFTLGRHKLAGFLSRLSCVFFIIFISACGGGSEPSSSETGAITCNIALQHTLTTRQAAGEPSEDCEAAGVDAVRVEVYDGADFYLTEGGPWPCSAHKGSVRNVREGSDRKVVILCEDSDERVRYRGEHAGITVTKGHTTDIGIVAAHFFIPTLSTPANGSNVTGDAVTLAWDAVEAAKEYRVVVSKNSDLGNPIVDQSVYDTSFDLEDLSEEATYYWQVHAVDSVGNEGAGSDIWKFETYINSPPRLLPWLRRAFCLPRRVPETPLHPISSRRTRTELPLRGVEEFLPPYQPFHESDGGVHPQGHNRPEDHGGSRPALSSQAISDHSQTHHVFYDQTLIRYPFHSAFKRFSGANT